MGAAPTGARYFMSKVQTSEAVWTQLIIDSRFSIWGCLFLNVGPPITTIPTFQCDKQMLRATSYCFQAL